ncbi:MAG: cupin domain-containing protein [Acidimicrobiales bacterium]
MSTPAGSRGVNLNEKLAQFDEHWSPRTIAQFNGHDVMVVKVEGEFTWHHHDDTDDFFLVLSGRIMIRMGDGEGDVELGPGELFVVPVGVEHQPYAEQEAEILLIEPTGTPNSGDATTAAPRIEI